MVTHQNAVHGKGILEKYAKIGNTYMPSPMIHLRVAYELTPEAPDLFWVANFAPDYTNDRSLKDEIHLRTASNRMDALRSLKNRINCTNPFDSGWLLHLFVDACWDETMIPAFRKKYEHTTEDWFGKYREETAFASFYLYHHVDWAEKIWAQIINADLSKLSTGLPVTVSDIEWFRARVYKRHSESDSGTVSHEYSDKQLVDFSKDTALRYKKWYEC